MSDFAYMPFSDYEDACDATREKTGKTEPIKSGDLAAEIRSIQTGGGSEDSITKDVWTIESDINTNTQTFYFGQPYIDRNYVGVQIIDITNNNAARNKAEGAVIDTRADKPGVKEIFLRGGIATVRSSGQAFNLTAGSVITRYKIPASMFPS